MDEVGRGALAGPVSVGVVCIDESCSSAPSGVRDSKLLTPSKRESLVEPVRKWALAWGVGHAAPAEIDELGIVAALRLAGRRALAACGLSPDLVVLDGKHDWLSDPARAGLLALIEGEAPAPPVHTRIKADLTCSSVAAASILAKVERDALMTEFAQEYPDYGWAVNKGYAAPGHLEALGRLGPCDLHRRSWNLSAALPPAEAGPTPERLAGRGRQPVAEEPVAKASESMVHDGRLEVRVDGR